MRNEKKIKIIDGESVQLRPLENGDLCYTLAWRNRGDARIWFKHSAELSEAQHQAWYESYVERDDDMIWVVWADGRRVGQVSVYDIDKTEGIAEVGRFLAAPEAAGHGFIFRACGLLINYCREQLRLHQLYLEVLPSNHRAIHLYHSLGFSIKQQNQKAVYMEKAL